MTKKTLFEPASSCCITNLSIEIQAADGVIQSVRFTGGCNGNLQGISKLVQGMKVEDAIAKLEGIRCGMKETSCPDQLAQALKKL